MKASKLTVGFLATIALLSVSCSDDDTGTINVNNGGGQNPVVTPGATEIGGTLSSDLTLLANSEYFLTSALIVPNGKKLTIEPGVVVKSATGSDVYIAVQQGGMINAEGTSTNPIVLTSGSATPNPGDWGGLIVLGKAPINSVTGGNATSTSEIGQLPYGGSFADDNSGIIKYVRVEYSGGKADASSENNGFSFYGVGNKTVVEYIQAFAGKDDGVEFFGGTVNASFISVVDCEDDSVDWTEGFTGKLTNVYVEHGAEHDKGIEADGFNTDIGNNSNPKFWSFPTVEKLTIVGRGSSNETEAIRLRAGTRVILNDVKIKGFEEAIDLDDEDGENFTGEGVTSGETKITDIIFEDVTVKLKNDTGATFTEADLISGDGNGNGTDYDSWKTGWTRN